MSFGNEELMKSTMKELEDLKVVGRGAMGTVLLVQREGCEKSLALKAMSKYAIARNGDDGLRRAQFEKNILSRLDHPFLPTLFGHVETQKIMAWLVEYCPGGDLNSLRHNITVYSSIELCQEARG
jgi:serine/threonine protein kinase